MPTPKAVHFYGMRFWRPLLYQRHSLVMEWQGGLFPADAHKPGNSWLCGECRNRLNTDLTA